MKHPIIYSKVDKHDIFTKDKEYAILGIEGNSHRVICDCGCPCLINETNINEYTWSPPIEWDTELWEDGELFCYPNCFFEYGFFEDVFDRDIKSLKVVEKYLMENNLKEELKRYRTWAKPYL
jgi:hypothetical protein